MLSLVVVWTMVLGAIPGGHLCALAATAEADDEDPHACCKDKEEMAAMAARVATNEDRAAAAAPEAAADLCGGSCCDTLGAAAPPTPPDAEAPERSLDWSAALPVAPERAGAATRPDRTAHPPRGPPPRRPGPRRHLQLCVQLN